MRRSANRQSSTRLFFAGLRHPNGTGILNGFSARRYVFGQRNCPGFRSGASFSTGSGEKQSHLHPAYNAILGVRFFLLFRVALRRVHR